MDAHAYSADKKNIVIRKDMKNSKKNTYHIQCHNGIHLNCAVEITKQDRYWQQQYIDGITKIMTQ